MTYRQLCEDIEKGLARQVSKMSLNQVEIPPSNAGQNSSNVGDMITDWVSSIDLGDQAVDDGVDGSAPIRQSYKNIVVDLWMADNQQELEFASRQLFGKESSILPKWNGDHSVSFLVVPPDDCVFQPGTVIDVVDGKGAVRALRQSLDEEVYRQDGGLRIVVFQSASVDTRRVLLAAIRSDLIQTDQREPSVDALFDLFNIAAGRHVYILSPLPSQFGVLRAGTWWNEMAKGGRLHLVLCNLDRLKDTGRDSSSPVDGAKKMFRDLGKSFCPGAWQWICEPQEALRGNAEKPVFKKLFGASDEGKFGRLRIYQIPQLCARNDKRVFKESQFLTPKLRTDALRTYLKYVESSVKALQSRKNLDIAADETDWQLLTVDLYDAAVAACGEVGPSNLRRYFYMLLCSKVMRRFVDEIVENIMNITSLSKLNVVGGAFYGALSRVDSWKTVLLKYVRVFCKRFSNLEMACGAVEEECKFEWTEGVAENVDVLPSDDDIDKCLSLLSSRMVVNSLKKNDELNSRIAGLLENIRNYTTVQTARGTVEKLLKLLISMSLQVKKQERQLARLESKEMSPNAVKILKLIASFDGGNVATILAAVK